MFLKLRPLLFSLIFLSGLELISLSPGLVYYAMAFLVILSVFEGKNIGKKWRYSIMPFFLVVSSFALLYLVSIEWEQQILIVIASLMYYLALFGTLRLGEYEKDQTAKGMNMAATSASIFFSFAGAYGLYLNFLVPLYVLMLTYLLTTLLISYQYFSIIEKDKKKIWTYSFLLALFMAEIIWTMNFWPFGYLTTGVTALILYYILWDMTQSHFLNILSKKRVVANMVFFSVMIIVVLVTSKWLPIF